MSSIISEFTVCFGIVNFFVNYFGIRQKIMNGFSWCCHRCTRAVPSSTSIKVAAPIAVVSEEKYFRFVRDIKTDYDLGKNVDLSTNRRTVLFAIQRETNIPVVIKVRSRERKKSFCDKQELLEWVESMKILHELRSANLPHVLNVLQCQSVNYGSVIV